MKALWRHKMLRHISELPRRTIDAGTVLTGPGGLRGSAVARCSALAGVAAMVVLNGCALMTRSTPVDPAIDFAAHRGTEGIVVDRMAGGQTAVLVPADSSSSSGGPTYLLQADGKTIAALWVTDRDHVVVRRTADPNGPVIGQVWASYEDNAMRLAFESAGGISNHTGRFYRRNVDSEEPPALGRNMFSVHDLPGVYRAALRNPQNVDVGWLRVDVGQYMAASRTYDGVLPTQLDGPLAVGAVTLIESQIARTERRAVDTWWSN